MSMFRKIRRGVRPLFLTATALGVLQAGGAAFALSPIVPPSGAPDKAAAKMAGKDAEQMGRRVALVIGNAAYQKLPSLPNPANDVQEVAGTLRGLGFDVTVGINVDRLSLEEKVRQFLRSADRADVGLIYYSGHGIQVGGQNFLVPVNATLDTPYDVETQTMPLDLIFNHLRQNSRVQLIFLDACRNNPFNAQKFWQAQTLQPVGATRGLARIDSDLGSLIAFSTEPGQVALDGNGTLSPYSEAFVKRVSQPAKEIRQVLTDVRRDVIAATEGKQVPWENSSLTDSFYFRPAPPPPAVEAMQQASVTAGTALAPLAIRPPHDETGAALKAVFSQVPQAGRIVLDGRVLGAGDEIAADAIARLAYDAAGVPAGTVGLIGYAVRDPYGQTTPGVVAITVAEDASAKIAEEKRKKDERDAAARAYVTAAAKTLPATIGTGPVAVGLPPAPQAAATLTVKVKALPQKGVLRAGDRLIAEGHVVELSELAGLSYEPQIGTEGGSFTLSLEGSDFGGAATLTFVPRLDPCDTQAAAPLDLQGVTAGRLPNEIDAKAALAACGAAVKAYPAVARFGYQLGRAQLAARDAKAAVETIKRAMDAGHVRAIEHMASLYRVGAIGERDPAKANAIVRTGAEKGDPYALYNYGKDLYYGLGTKADTEKGLKLMLQAADLGHTYAMNELGYIFLNGISIAADPARAIRFYEAGVARNDIYSMNNLALVYRFGKGVPVDLDRARVLFTQAADGGQPFAPTNLGRMYRDGTGVTADLAAATKWLELGAERGDYWGAFDRAQLARQSAEGRADPVTAARYFALAQSLNRPGTGDPENLAVKELARLPESAKKQAEDGFADQLTPAERKAATKSGTLDERLVALARAAWVKRNPRYDLF